jgi:hypothetical protein
MGRRTSSCRTRRTIISRSFFNLVAVLLEAETTRFVALQIILLRRIATEMAIPTLPVAASNAISLHYNHGDGTFDADPNLAIDSVGLDILSADFNRDGAPDLLTTLPNTGSTINVLYGSPNWWQPYIYADASCTERPAATFPTFGVAECWPVERGGSTDQRGLGNTRIRYRLTPSQVRKERM